MVYYTSIIEILELFTLMPNGWTTPVKCQVILILLEAYMVCDNYMLWNLGKLVIYVSFYQLLSLLCVLNIQVWFEQQ